MKIAAISDTHSYHRTVAVPECDVLVHAGDVSWRGEWEILKDFVDWLCEQKQARHKCVIFGNHELYPEDDPSMIPLLFDKDIVKENNIYYLQDSSVTIEGLVYYGSPYSPWFHDWSYSLPERDHLQDYQGAKNKWNEISENTDILITHTPVRGILDKCLRDDRVGCPVLRKRVGELPNLKAHICGHIHEARGKKKIDGIQFVNAAVCNINYDPINKPIVIEV